MNTQILHDYKIVFETIGCKLNQIETEAIAHAFIQTGFNCILSNGRKINHGADEVILCVINTCTVTGKAEQKARRLIRFLLKQYQFAAFLITGCYAEMEPDTLLKIDNRVAVVGGKNKNTLIKLPHLMASLSLSEIQGQNLAERINDFYKSFIRSLILKPQTPKDLQSVLLQGRLTLNTPEFAKHTRPSVKIQDGCNSRCTYCRICLARGKSISLPPSEILAHIQKFEQNDHSEVVITGVNIAQYSYQGNNFADLLQYLIENTSSIAFRISSMHPQLVTDKLCKILVSPRVRPHFHISAQSGSDAVLQAMERPHSAQRIIEAVKKLRAIKPHAFIACDMIVGFPGETNEDFQQTVDMCKQCNFAWIHSFPFSARPDTPAFSFKNQIDPAIKDERAKQLSEIAITQKKAYLESCVGQEVLAIIEKHRNGVTRAVSENFLHITILKNTYKNIAGKQVTVKIEGIQSEDFLMGEAEVYGTITKIETNTPTSLFLLK